MLIIKNHNNYFNWQFILFVVEHNILLVFFYIFMFFNF